ncbi:MAG: YkgJ family cysteine cluster protein [Planctomycetes bacterium]|nr:YkgJ family cysteine cluster protein [Planctomycetota bacterium]
MSEPAPWYKDGLRFTCTQCGDCCTGEPGVVWIDDEEVARIAELTGKPVAEVRLFHTRLVGDRVTLIELPNGDCTFLDGKTRRCSIYQARPRQCRSWPFWPSNLKTPQAWQEVERVCPGAGQGAFVSLEEIERQSSLIDI